MGGRSAVAVLILLGAFVAVSVDGTGKWFTIAGVLIALGIAAKVAGRRR